MNSPWGRSLKSTLLLRRRNIITLAATLFFSQRVAFFSRNTFIAERKDDLNISDRHMTLTSCFYVRARRMAPHLKLIAQYTFCYNRASFITAFHSHLHSHSRSSTFHPRAERHSFNCGNRQCPPLRLVRARGTRGLPNPTTPRRRFPRRRERSCAHIRRRRLPVGGVI